MEFSLAPAPACAPGSDRSDRPASPLRRPAGRRSAAAHERAEVTKVEATLDAGLVQRFKAGDTGAFDEIVGRYHQRMLAIALRFLGNHADAEEIAQDTFIRAHRALTGFRGDSSLATWLHRIAVNLSRNRYWYFFRRQRHMAISLDCPLGTESSETFSDLIATPDADPARHASVDEFNRMVGVCMERLAPSEREILGLRNLLNRSHAEIASALGINPGTVKSRIARARGRLRELLADAYPETAVAVSRSDWFVPARGAARLN